MELGKYCGDGLKKSQQHCNTSLLSNLLHEGHDASCTGNVCWHWMSIMQRRIVKKKMLLPWIFSVYWSDLYFGKKSKLQHLQLQCEHSVRELEWQNFAFLAQQSSSLSKIKMCSTGEDLLPLDTVTCPLQFLCLTEVCVCRSVLVCLFVLASMCLCVHDPPVVVYEFVCVGDGVSTPAGRQREMHHSK